MKGVAGRFGEGGTNLLGLGTSPREEPWQSSCHTPGSAGWGQWNCTSGSLRPFTSPLRFVLILYSPQLVKTRTSKIGELSNYVR